MFVDGCGGWSSDGCRAVNGDNFTDPEIYCECNHLTNFAMLLVSCIHKYKFFACVPCVLMWLCVDARVHISILLV